MQHGRLAFDSDFFHSVEQCYEDEEGSNPVNIINNILFFRAGPVKKFILRLSSDDPRPEESDFKRWCLFLSRNGVEELNLYLESNLYKLPSCIVSCQTIKLLILDGFILYLPINDRCIFPGVTSLAFSGVEFGNNENGIVYSIPNLEKLTFHFCVGFSDFEFNAPNLKRLTVNQSISEVGSKCFWLNPKAIMTLCLDRQFLKVRISIVVFSLLIYCK
nr:F-box/FBD/LRR-repeat protein At1g13570-like [Ipomoea batatas]